MVGKLVKQLRSSRESMIGDVRRGGSTDRGSEASRRPVTVFCLLGAGRRFIGRPICGPDNQTVWWRQILAGDWAQISHRSTSYPFLQKGWTCPKWNLTIAMDALCLQRYLHAERSLLKNPVLKCCKVIIFRSKILVFLEFQYLRLNGLTSVQIFHVGSLLWFVKFVLGRKNAGKVMVEISILEALKFPGGDGGVGCGTGHLARNITEPGSRQ